MKTGISRLLLLGAALTATLALRADPVLAGHAGLKAQTVDAEGAKSLLLGKKIMLGDTRVVIVILKSSAGQDAFLQSHVAMNTAQLQSYWRRLFMTGGGTAPKLAESEEEAAKLLAETPGAIAIIDSAKANGLAVVSQ